MRHFQHRLHNLVLPLALSAILLLPGCATIQGLTALRDVDFSLDRVAGAQLAGMDISRVRSFSDLGLLDAARLTAAVAQKNLPLRFTLHVGALNPEGNSVTARLVQLDWALLLDGSETISGIVNEVRPLAPGVQTDIPIAIELNLIEFFDRSAGELVELVQAIAGGDGAPTRIQLRATPTVETPVGPIRYPNPITIVSREVG